MMSAVSAEEETLALEESISMEIPSPGATRPTTSHPEPKTPDSASLPAVVVGIDDDDALAMDPIPPPTATITSPEDTWSGALSRLGSVVRSSVSEAARAVSAATAVGGRGVAPRILFVGDGHTAKGEKCTGWISLLRERFNLRARLENYGAVGYCATWGTRVLLRALRDERDAKVVLIWFGAEDATLPPATAATTVENYRLALAKMAVHCVNEKIVPVFITPPVVVDGMKEGKTSENAEIYADACKRIAHEMKVPCIDVYKAMEGAAAKYIDDDGALSIEGNKLMERLVVELFESKLRKFAPSNLQHPFVPWIEINPDDPSDTLGVGL